MTERLEVTVDGPRIHVAGELDLTTVTELTEAANGLLGDGATITVDLDGLTFIDSTGLSTLVDLHQQAAGAGGSLSLVAVPDHAKRLMQITKIDELLGL